MINGILATLAIIGLLTSIIGRWMISSEAGEISIWWKLAVSFLDEQKGRSVRAAMAR